MLFLFYQKSWFGILQLSKGTFGDLSSSWLNSFIVRIWLYLFLLGRRSKVVWCWIDQLRVWVSSDDAGFGLLRVAVVAKDFGHDFLLVLVADRGSWFAVDAVGAICPLIQQLFRSCCWICWLSLLLYRWLCTLLGPLSIHCLHRVPCRSRKRKTRPTR